MTDLKRQYLLKGLDCAGCAGKIEREVASLTGVEKASVDFATQILTVKLMSGQAPPELQKKVISIAKQHDSNIIVMPKTSKTEQAAKTLYLKGLDCAACAEKITTAVRRLAGIKKANLDFTTQKLTIEAWDRQDLPALAREAAQIAQRIEPKLTISNNSSLNADTDISEPQKIRQRLLLAGGTVIFTAALTLPLSPALKTGLFLTAYILSGGSVLLRASRNLLKGQMWDENFLMSIATIGAIAIGEYPEAVAVMLFYQVGEIFQHLAVERSRRSIASLMDIRPDFANLQTAAGLKKVAPEEIKVGELIVVRPGERIPLDGRVTSGQSALDTSALTGEAIPVNVAPGSKVLAGSINQNGLLTIEVEREFASSTVARILDLVQNAGSRKSPTENFITRFARWYTPLVVGAALVLAVIPPLIFSGAQFSVWLDRALVFLVVSCPCALVISIPLSFFGGIGDASRNGILVKGSNFLQALNQVDTVVFDKTGTLTKGVFEVTDVSPVPGRTREDLLFYAAHAESHSTHPIAVSIRKAYGLELNPDAAGEAEEIAGQGLRVTVNGHNILAGNSRLLQAAHIPFEPAQTTGTIIYLAIDNTYAGHIVINDTLKTDSPAAIKELRRNGVRRIVMLTGDAQAPAAKVAEKLSLDAFYAGLLPEDKVMRLEELDKSKPGKGSLIFVGDGINDAPVLARADVAVAMGGLGSDAAIEAADVVLMTDEPVKLVQAMRIAQKTHKIVWQNIIFALSVKGLILVLGALGQATMWEAVFGDVGVTVLAVFNAMRAMHTYPAAKGNKAQKMPVDVYTN